MGVRSKQNEIRMKMLGDALTRIFIILMKCNRYNRRGVAKPAKKEGGAKLVKCEC